MDDFPPEILHKICRHLCTSDVSSFRLLNQKCSNIGAEYLCPVVSVILTSQSVERLQRISEHPLLCENVRTFLFVPLRLPDASEWTLFDIECIKKAQCWNWCLAENQRWDDYEFQKTTVHRIGRILSSFPRLRTLVLSRQKPKHVLRKHVRKLRIFEENHMHLVAQGDRLAFWILEYAIKNCPLLNGLELYVEGDGTVYPYFGREDWPVLLENIEHIGWDYARKSKLTQKENCNPRPLFLAPRRLRSMKVGLFSFRGLDFDLLEYLHFARVVEKDHFCSLEKLDIQHNIIDEQHFSEFLKTHAPSLRHLVLESIVTEESGLLLPLFKTMGTLSLKSLVIGGTWYEELSIHSKPRSFLRTQSIVSIGKDRPKIGQLVSSVTLGLWQFVDDEYTVVPCSRKEGAVDILKPQLLKILFYYSLTVSRSQYFGEMITHDGFILFKEDVLFENLKRRERLLEDIDAMPDVY